MTQTNRLNRVRYRLYAPVYDRLVTPLERGRERAIERLELTADDRILLLGSGPGVDLDYLPSGADITAVDITPAMVRRTERRAAALGLDVDGRVGNAGDLPLADDTFDAVLLHLVLSVVPDPAAVATETARVLAPDGRVSIYDKFVPEGADPSLPRRLLNPVARVLFSDLIRPLEPLFADTGLELGSRASFLGGLCTVTVARPSGR
jgi:ubiquinone/menaquinone biosynthesis C-methylase UbiE